MNEHEKGQVAASAAEIYEQFFVPALFAGAGMNDVTIHTITGKARFASLETWIYTDIKGWTLADIVDDEGYQRLLRYAPKKLAQFVQADGTVIFDAPAHIVVVNK